MNQKFGMILPITLFAYFLILMDNSIIFTSSVEIGNSLKLDSSNLAWVSNAYTLTFGGFLLLSGRLTDLLGRKMIFQIGLFIFTLSSLIIGLAQNAGVLIAARAIQGIGSSIIAPTTLALMMDAYRGEMRTRAISYYGATSGIGGSIGHIIGGGLTSFISWRAGFLINVPLSLFLMYLTYRFVEEKEGRKEQVDYLGSLLSVVGGASLIYSLTGSSYQWFFFLLGVFLLIAFYLREKVAPVPIMPLLLFANRVRLGAYLVRLLYMMALLPYWFLLPQLLQSHYGYNALQSGLAFLPLTLVAFLVALILPRLSEYFDNARILLIGEVVLLVGFIWASFSNLDNGYLLAVALPMLLIGLGQGLILAPVTAAGIYQAPNDLAGAASGLTNTMHQVGGPIGLSLLIAIGGSFSTSLLIMALFTAIALILVYFLIFPK